MPNNDMIDLGKFRSYYDQLADIQKVVDKLITKQNASVYNKIGTKTEILFNSINAIDLKSAPLEDIREIINLLKKLRETCITLSTYKQYLMSIIPNTIDKLDSVTLTNEPEIEVGPSEGNEIIAQSSIDNKTLELSNIEGNVA